MWNFCRDVAASVVDLLAPRRCAGCDMPCRRSLCAQCVAQVVSPPPMALEGIPLFSVGAYTPPLSLGVKRLKYQGRPDICVPLGALLAEAPGLAENIRSTRLAPVPLHPSRLKLRGFNQSALLARELATRLSLRVDHALLRRVRGGLAQALCNGADRRSNILGAFSARSDDCPLPVTLVDDVITTGATATDCIRALQAAGHRVAAVIAICTTGKADC